MGVGITHLRSTTIPHIVRHSSQSTRGLICFGIANPVRECRGRIVGILFDRLARKYDGILVFPSPHFALE